VVERVRLELGDVDQPYHEAVGLPGEEAAALVEGATRTAFARAAAEVEALVRDRSVVGVGVVCGAGTVREDVPLARALTAHSLLHAAEGELYRDALAAAADAVGLPVMLVVPRETSRLGRSLLGCSDDAELRTRLTEIGRTLGPPWTRDHKDALTAALAVLEP
jgi:hypothetical protein